MSTDGGVALPPARGEPRDGYESKFANWEKRSAVRTKPSRTFGEGERSMLFFPPEFVPALRHPLVQALGPEAAHRLLVQSLYTYLHFTVVLEQLAVIPVTARIALGRSGVELPARMRADAYKITTDEAWHAQFCFDFVDQVVQRCGVPMVSPDDPRFILRLDEIRQGFEPDARPLVDLFFAVVSETLLSSLLLELPNDRRLPASVRALVMDHAEDEGRHHAYFRTFLRFLWPQVGEAHRRLIGPVVPELVYVFLEPDGAAVAAALRDAGLDQREVATVVDDCYPAADVSPSIVAASRATVRCFRDVGALEDPATHAAFAARGLVS